MTAEKKPKIPEEWVRYDTTTVKVEDLPDWLQSNDEAFRKDPAVIAAAERAAQRALLDAIPPDGRSTPDRSALAREPRAPMEFSHVKCACGFTMVKRAGVDCRCLICGSLVGN